MRVTSLEKMAAPTLSKAEARQNFGEKGKQKQKKEIKKQKNVLFNPFPFKWPVLDKYFEGRILDDLQSLLQSLPVRLPKRPASYFKGKKKGVEGERQVTVEDRKQEEQKKELRSQFVCGVREVTKGLERDNLDLVLVCRSSQPSMVTKHLIPLAASRGCPAICIPEFNPKIAPLLGVTSLVAFGFKKLPPDSQSKFSEFVTYAKSHAIPLDTPWVNKSLGIVSRDDSKPVTETSPDEASVQDKSGGDAAGEVSRGKSSGQSTGDFISLSTTKPDFGQSDSPNEQGTTSNKTKDLSGFVSLSGSTSGFLPLISVSDDEKGDTAPCDTVESSSTQVQMNSTLKNGSDKIKAGSSLVFPLDGPPPFVPKGDYSHLYVFKSEGKFGDSYISLDGRTKGVKRELSHVSSGSESESVEEEGGGILGLEEPVAKKPKHSLGKEGFEEYRPALIRTQIPNLNKKNKKLTKRKSK